MTTSLSDMTIHMRLYLVASGHLACKTFFCCSLFTCNAELVLTISKMMFEYDLTMIV
jgi:hypothetical protein